MRPVEATDEAQSDPSKGPQFFEALSWLADAASIVQTSGELKVVPWCPTPDKMWELGKLCGDRLGLYQKVNRVARQYGQSLESAPADRPRPFLLGGVQVTSWAEVLVLEAVVGPFYRLFYESFLRSSDQDIAELADALWRGSQLFIRFGQAELAIALGEDPEPFQAAVDTLLPAALGLLDETPAELDRSWLAYGYREKPNASIKADYTEEIATYLNAADLEIPKTCRDAFPEPEVRWVGENFASTRRTGPLRQATFAFSQKSTGRETVSAGTSPERAPAPVE
jgi:hypothetical protein